MLARFVASLAAVAAVLPLVPATPTSGFSPLSLLTTPASGIDVQAFSRGLSKKTQIYCSGDKQFKEYTVRWSNLEAPTVNVVVVPGTEQDVSKIVAYAYQNDIPILAYNGHHGSLTTLGKMDYGIAINLVQLDSLKVAKDGKTVTVGGGINSHNMTEALWAAGKQAVTGTCECVSYLGPALGGGHGWLQGHHGLISDQFVSMNVVLATGQVLKVDEKSDLFWGMKGAGHNFGIVTSVTSKIFDIEHSNWAIETIVFGGDKIEAVYEAANEHLIQDGQQTADIHQWSYWLNDATLDADKPVIVVYTIQEGVDTVDPKYTQAFKDIGPLAVTPQSGTYRDLGAWTNIALDSPPCQDFGFNNPRFPIYVKSYNATALRAAYDLYADKISGAENPYSNSIFMFEDYATGGVRAIDDRSSAFAFRTDRVLAAPLIIYNSTGAAEDNAVAELGNQLRDIVHQGTQQTELHTYVNYAYGTETTQEWYGHEAWRQERLRALKTKYDPRGKFSFYAPIA